MNVKTKSLKNKLFRKHIYSNVIFRSLMPVRQKFMVFQTIFLITFMAYITFSIRNMLMNLVFMLPERRQIAKDRFTLTKCKFYSIPDMNL